MNPMNLEAALDRIRVPSDRLAAVRQAYRELQRAHEIVNHRDRDRARGWRIAQDTFERARQETNERIAEAARLRAELFELKRDRTPKRWWKR